MTGSFPTSFLLFFYSLKLSECFPFPFYYIVHEHSHLTTVSCKKMPVFSINPGVMVRRRWSWLFSCVYNCDDQSCIRIFLRSSNIWSFIYSLVSSPFTGLLRTHNVTNSPCLDNSVSRALHRYRRAHGFVQA